MIDKLKILIVSEHASAQFGGEAALPLHYYRVLRARNIDVWLLVHERTRKELVCLYPNDHDNIIYIADTVIHKLLWRISQLLPSRLAAFTTGFLMRIATQLAQRPIIKKMVSELHINVIHQPMPVSPKEPSLIFGFGVPVVIGPMNGGIDYPPAFNQLQGKFESWTLAIGRKSANFLNFLMPGKRKAACLLVANKRTKLALPSCLSNVATEILVENGVDLGVWRQRFSEKNRLSLDGTVHFVYMGRLVDWKAVDILVEAFAAAADAADMRLTIIGDGDQRVSLEALSEKLEVLSEAPLCGKVHFVGWLPQSECANFLVNADALVLTSLMECGGAVVLEAMAMGLPVIAADWGGPADYIDSSCGMLVKPTSRAEFKDGIRSAFVKLASNNELRLALGSAGRLKVENYFDWDKKTEKILTIYRNQIADFTS